ncbi:hypothetical protein G6F56_012859 [Rhizopus delemar]|nr:hypothetical protein G6F56_012859 [Rhizopus delemar]
MNSISTELFFNEAEFSVIIPNHEKQTIDPLGILQASRREFAFYDEHLHVYLLASIPNKKSGTGEEVKDAINTFYSQLEITLDATFIDPPHVQRSSLDSPKLNANRRQDTPFFTQAFNRNSTKQTDMPIFEHNESTCFLYLMVVPIGTTAFV